MKVEIAQRHQVFESSLFRYKYSFQKTQWSNEMSETIIELIKYLRTHQEFLYQILINTNDFSQVNSLSILVSDFLYDNIFTTKGIEDDYLFLLCKLIKNDINNMNEFNVDSFAKYNITHSLMKKLALRREIQDYLKIIVLPILNELTTFEKIGTFSFDKDKLTVLAKEESKFDRNTIKGILNSDEFYCKYIADITKDTLIGEREQNEDYKMKDYFDKQIAPLMENENLYGISSFLQTIEDQSVLELYKFFFSIVIETISTLIQNLIQNIDLIPVEIRFLCKVILMLVKKKFPEKSQVEYNAFIGKFFFSKLIESVLLNSNYLGLITSPFKYTKVLPNITCVLKIMNAFIKGDFFTTTKMGNYTIFNWYFIYEMPKLFEFFDKLVDIELPDKIVNLVSYDKEDFSPIKETELIDDYSFTYSTEQVLALISIIKKKEDLFKNMIDSEELMKIYNIMNSNCYYDKILNIKHKEDESGITTFSFVRQFTYSEAMKKIIDCQENYEENFLIKVLKLNLKKLLITLENIPEKYFCNKRITTTDDFFKALLSLTTKQNISPLIIDTYYSYKNLFTLQRDLYNEISKDDYSKLYNDIYQEILTENENYQNDLINQLDSKKEDAKEKMIYSSEVLKLFFKYEFYIKALSFIKTQKVEIIDKTEYNKTNPDELFNLNGDFDDLRFKPLKNVSSSTALNVDDVLKKFPNFVYFYSNLSEREQINFDHKKTLYSVIDKYIQTMERMIQKEERFDFELYNDYMNDAILFKRDSTDKERKIEQGKKKMLTFFINYFIEMLYEKIYFYQESKDDITIEKNCKRLSFVKPNNFFDENINFFAIFDKCEKYVNKIDTKRTPVEKLNQVNKIKLLIADSLGATFDREIKQEDVSSLLTYFIIKARPRRLASNVKFIKQYLKDDSLLVHLNDLEESLQNIKTMNYSCLKNISKIDFIK